MDMVVIVDWSLRNFDFRHLAANIFTYLPAHRLGENIRVVEDKDIVPETAKLGIRDYILKSSSSDGLLQRIRRVLE